MIHLALYLVDMHTYDFESGILDFMFTIVWFTLLLQYEILQQVTALVLVTLTLGGIFRWWMKIDGDFPRQ